MARVRALLRFNQILDPVRDSIQVKDHVINPTSREVFRDKQQLHLSRKEFDLLHLLAIKPGRILTHQVLLSTLWGDSFVNETHYLRVLVGHLRQKLSDDPMQPDYIVTVQGVGYRLKS
jgi:two-component system KDP operon response regulator KdpE